MRNSKLKHLTATLFAIALLIRLGHAATQTEPAKSVIQQGLEDAKRRLQKDEQSLRGDLKSNNIEDRVGSALVLWSKFPGAQADVLGLMKNDPNPDVRRRIAQTLAVKYGIKEAVPVLEKVMSEFNITSEAGATSMMSAASALRVATGKSYGTKEVLSILNAPPTWFADAARYKNHAYLRRDGVKTQAASLLSEQVEMKRDKDFREALRAYCKEVDQNIDKTTGTERKHWEGRLPGLLNIAVRADMNDLVDEFSASAVKIKDGYAKDMFERVRQKARGKDK